MAMGEGGGVKKCNAFKIPKNKRKVCFDFIENYLLCAFRSISFTDV